MKLVLRRAPTELYSLIQPRIVFSAWYWLRSLTNRYIFRHTQSTNFSLSTLKLLNGMPTSNKRSLSMQKPDSTKLTNDESNAPAGNGTEQSPRRPRTPPPAIVYSWKEKNPSAKLVYLRDAFQTDLTLAGMKLRGPLGFDISTLR